MSNSPANRTVLTPQTAIATRQSSFGQLVPFDWQRPTTARITGFVRNNVAIPAAGSYGHRLTPLVTASDLSAASVVPGLVCPGAPLLPSNQVQMDFYVGHATEADLTTATAFVWLETRKQHGIYTEYVYTPAFALALTGGGFDVAAGSKVVPSAGTSELASVNWCDTIAVTLDSTYRGSAEVLIDPAAHPDCINSVVFDALGATGFAVVFRCGGTAEGVGGTFRVI